MMVSKCQGLPDTGSLHPAMAWTDWSRTARSPPPGITIKMKYYIYKECKVSDAGV